LSATKDGRHWAAGASLSILLGLHRRARFTSPRGRIVEALVGSFAPISNIGGERLSVVHDGTCGAGAESAVDHEAARARSFDRAGGALMSSTYGFALLRMGIGSGRSWWAG